MRIFRESLGPEYTQTVFADKMGNGYTSLKFCYSGYITIRLHGSRGIDKVNFMVTDGRDIIDKLIRYEVLDTLFL